MFDVGRVCLKVAGREAGKYCVIIKKIDDNFVMVTGPKELTKVKRRRCNIDHLEPIMESLKIKSDASDHEVLRAYQEANLMVKLSLEKPKRARAEKPKAVKVKPEKKARVKKKGEAKPKRRPKPKPPKPGKPKAERKAVKRASAKKAGKAKKK